MDESREGQNSNLNDGVQFSVNDIYKREKPEYFVKVKQNERIAKIPKSIERRRQDLPIITLVTIILVSIMVLSTLIFLTIRLVNLNVAPTTNKVDDAVESIMNNAQMDEVEDAIQESKAYYEKAIENSKDQSEQLSLRISYAKFLISQAESVNAREQLDYIDVTELSPEEQIIIYGVYRDSYIIEGDEEMQEEYNRQMHIIMVSNNLGAGE